MPPTATGDLELPQQEFTLSPSSYLVSTNSQQNWVSRDSHNFSLSPSLSFSPIPTCMHILERLGLAHFSFFHNSHSFNSLSSIKKNSKQTKTFIRHWERNIDLCVCQWPRLAGPSFSACGCSTHTESRPDSWWAPKPPASILPGVQAFTGSHLQVYRLFRTFQNSGPQPGCTLESPEKFYLKGDACPF